MKKRRQLLIIIIISTLVLLIWNLPSLQLIRYPLLLLGTWFHEMGHGITAMLLGGDFLYLEIYENGGGTAYSTISNSYVSQPLARALTAAGGLLGPTIAGALLIVSAKHNRSSLIALWALVSILIISLLIWIKSLIAWIVLGIIAVLLVIIILLKKKNITSLTILFLGTQCVFSSYLQIGYLFTKQFERDGQIQYSDTQVIASYVFGTYWMWGLLILLISVYVLYRSYRYYLRN